MKTRGDRGVMGISMLILFIALVLVAAIAAAVLLSASSSLQQTAIDRSDRTERSLSTSVDVIGVMATDGSDGSVEDFEVLMKLQAGSEPMTFNYTVVSVVTSSFTQEMEYNGSGTTAVGTTMYYVEWIKEGPEYEMDYLGRGDLVKVRFHVGTSVSPGNKVHLRIMPKNGFVTPIDFTTPVNIKEAKLSLYPLAM